MLKYFALLTMFLDHFNHIIFSQHYLIFTIIGRFAFPLFIYISVISYIRYTRSKINYIFRILIFAIFSTPFYMYGFSQTFFPLNILFTIFLGLSLLLLIEKELFIFTWIPFALALYCDYSLFGVLSFLAFYYFIKFPNFKSVFILFVSLFLLNPPYLNIYLPFLFVLLFYDFYFKSFYRSSLNKYFFYFFYPFHIFILGLLK